MYARLSFLGMVLATVLLAPSLVEAQTLTTGTATTTLTLSICGNALVDEGEQCDVPGETGVYSTTIAGRQCSTTCNFGPYCGDGILQTSFGEECDDGNNENGDFCSAICKIEPAGSGGGGSSGGGGGGRGGSQTELGDTVISVTGLAYPGRTINILIDTLTVGSVRAGNDGRFDFTTNASPGTASLGIWSTDQNNVRSITLNSTFDVTQGAVTNISGIFLPPTISIPNANVNPGDIVPVSGQSAPNSRIELHINNSERVETTTSNASGLWSVSLNTATLRVAQHTLRARAVSGNPPLTTQSNFSTALQLFVGVDGQATRPSDLNRDNRVNLVDFSILIFWWGTNGGNSNPPADINGNGRVGIEDFSILLFNWTG
jgi:cysteine-rich repeat protein